MNRYVVDEMMGNFSFEVYVSDEIESCQDFVLKRCREYVKELASKDPSLDINIELENQLSYFSIRESKTIQGKRP